jgi:uncharacterized BrkB/YihY/UPF0761 family membrane protein
MTSAFAQLERGANRVYGVERDRPALRKYARAAALTATAGTALGVGLVLIVAGGAFGEALEDVYRWGDAAETVWDVVRCRSASRRSSSRWRRSSGSRPGGDSRAAVGSGSVPG